MSQKTSDEDTVSPDQIPEDLENFRVDTGEQEEAVIEGYLKALRVCRRSLSLAYARVLKAEGQLDAAIQQWLMLTRVERSSLRRSVARGPDKGGFSPNVLTFRRNRGYLDLSWAEVKNGPLGTSYKGIRATKDHTHLSALLSGAHPSEVAGLKIMELKAREFRLVDRELRDAKNQLEILLKTFGLLDARSDPRRRKARKKN